MYMEENSHAEDYCEKLEQHAINEYYFEGRHK